MLFSYTALFFFTTELDTSTHEIRLFLNNRVCTKCKFEFWKM